MPDIHARLQALIARIERARAELFMLYARFETSPPAQLAEIAGLIVEGEKSYHVRLDPELETRRRECGFERYLEGVHHDAFSDGPVFPGESELDRQPDDGCP